QPDHDLPSHGIAPEDVASRVTVEIMARGESRPEETRRDESRRAASQRAEQSPESRFRLWTHCFLPPIVIVTSYARAIIFSSAAISVRPSTALEQPIGPGRARRATGREHRRAVDQPDHHLPFVRVLPEDVAVAVRVEVAGFEDVPGAGRRTRQATADHVRAV